MERNFDRPWTGLTNTLNGSLVGVLTNSLMSYAQMVAYELAMTVAANQFVGASTNTPTAGYATVWTGSQNANGSYSLSSVAFSPLLVGLGNVANAAQVTSVTGTAGTIGSTGGTTPVISLLTIGTAGTDTKVQVDEFGRITNSTTLSASDIPTLTAYQPSSDALTNAATGGSAGQLFTSTGSGGAWSNALFYSTAFSLNLNGSTIPSYNASSYYFQFFGIVGIGGLTISSDASPLSPGTYSNFTASIGGPAYLATTNCYVLIRTNSPGGSTFTFTGIRLVIPGPQTNNTLNSVTTNLSLTISVPGVYGVIQWSKR